MERNERYSKCYSELSNRFPNSIIEWNEQRQVWQALTSKQATRLMDNEKEDEDEDEDFYW